MLFSGMGAFAQPAANYLIDADMDGSTDGILYRDVVYTSGSQLLFFADHLGGPGSFTYSRDVEQYDGSTKDLTLDIYYADYGTDSLAARDKPVVFFFYGGGFSQGTSARVKDLCFQYASRGYVAVAPNYSIGYYGAYPEDSFDLCTNMRSLAEAPYRAMLDAQAAMRWVRDSIDHYLGLDVSADHFFVQGPSFFPMLSHMQSDEVSGSLQLLGTLDDSIKIKASVGRSAAINLLENFIDEDDTAPFLIFQGTCDKSVPFSRFTLSSRFGCDSIPDSTGVAPSIPGDAMISGSFLIVQNVNHYFEYYPICGLHHSLKNVEEQEMREPMAKFFYNVMIDSILPTDAPYIEPYIVAPCDINGKCAGQDRFGWCNGATQLDPEDGSGSCARSSRLPDMSRLDERLSEPINGMMVFPNPTTGPITITLEMPQAGTGQVQVFDAFGRLAFATNVDMVRGLNVQRLELPSSLPSGMYVVQVNGLTAGRVLKR
jgi:hypothetical protein